MAARKLHGFVYITIALCCMAIVICGVALGTNQWFSAEASSKTSTSNLKIDVKYGLFKGTKSKTATGNNFEFDLKLVCEGAKCMYSCGKTAEFRKQDLKEIIKNGLGVESGDAVICQTPGTSKIGAFNISGRQSNGIEPDLVFLNFGLYIITILLLGLAIAFSALGGVLALYNTYRTPIQPVLSVFGLYIWNGISSACVFLAMIMWGVVYSTSLRKNAAVSDTLVGEYTSDGKGKLGISFWILVLGIIFPLVNIGILKYRSWKIIQMEAKNVKVMTEKLESGDILLF